MENSIKAHSTQTAEQLTEAENYLLKSEKNYKNEIQNIKKMQNW